MTRQTRSTRPVEINKGVMINGFYVVVPTR
jgi:hypothetical protein